MRLPNLLTRHLGSHGRPPLTLWTSLLIVIIPAALVGAILRRSLGAGGRVQFLLLSPKGRITTYAPPIELWLRGIHASGKRPRWKLVVNPGVTPNTALRALYLQSERGLYIIDDDSHPLIWMFWLLVERVQRPRDGYKHQELLRASTGLWLERPRLRPPRKTGVQTAPLAVGSRPLVAISTRQGAYYNLRARQPSPQRPDLLREVSSIRNVDIGVFAPIAQQLTARGFTVVRMGQAVDSPTPAAMTRIEPWDPGADLEVFGSANLHLCGATGTWSLSAIFNRIVLIVDNYEVSPKLMDWTPYMWVMFRPLFDTSSGSYLRLEEALRLTGGNFVSFAAGNPRFELRSNSAELIASATNFVLNLPSNDPSTWPMPSPRERSLLEQMFKRQYDHGRFPRIVLTQD